MAQTLVMGALVALLLATLVNVVRLRLTWARRYGSPPLTFKANPSAWLAYWRPLLLIVQIHILIATAAMVALLQLALSAEGVASAITLLGFAMGLGIVVLGFVALDIWLILRHRHTQLGR